MSGEEAAESTAEGLAEAGGGPAEGTAEGTAEAAEGTAEAAEGTAGAGGGPAEEEGGGSGEEDEVAGVGAEDEEVALQALHWLYPTYATEVNSPLRHVRTRVYSTSGGDGRWAPYPLASRSVSRCLVTCTSRRECNAGMADGTRRHPAACSLPHSSLLALVYRNPYLHVIMKVQRATSTPSPTSCAIATFVARRRSPQRPLAAPAA